MAPAPEMSEAFISPSSSSSSSSARLLPPNANGGGSGTMRPLLADTAFTRLASCATPHMLLVLAAASAIVSIGLLVLHGDEFVSQIPILPPKTISETSSEYKELAGTDFGLFGNDALGLNTSLKSYMRFPPPPAWRVPTVLHPDLVALTNFKFCTLLNGSIFNANVKIDSFNGSISTAGHQLAIDIIDVEAKNLYDVMVEDDTENLPKAVDLRRFCCRVAAQGSSSLIKLSEEPWLVHVDPRIYYPKLTLDSTSPAMNATLDISGIKGFANQNSPAIQNPTHRNCQFGRKYKVAFLILIHERLDVVRRQLDAIYDPESIYLYHIDGDQKEFQEELLEWLHTNSTMQRECNVLVMSNNIPVHWGHSSIVFAQLEGYYQLLELADWSHVINLSVYDYPLKTAKAIYNNLKKTPDTSYIGWWDEEHAQRLRTPMFSTAEDRKWRPFFNMEREYVLRDRFKPLKHHQWMILSRDYVTQLRAHPGAYDLLTWVEHTMIPDEMYFASWALAPESPVKDKIINNMRKYLRFRRGHPSPDWLGIKDIKFLNNRSLFFARKINPLDTTGLIEWMDEWRNRADHDE